MTCIVHISDLHFGREQPLLVAALAAQIAHLAPDLVVASGDLTQRARPRELRAAAAFLSQLPPPVLVIPGNHDMPGAHPRRLLDPWRGWRTHFGPDLEPVVAGADFIAVGINSARRWGWHPDWSRGRLHPLQIEAVAARLQATPAHALRILAAHHPLLLTPAGAGRGLVGGHVLALARLRAAGLDLALGGHVHLGYADVTAGIVVAHSGSSVSNRLIGEANGFNLISGDRTALRVEHWQWQGHAFAVASAVGFQRGDQGWQRAIAPV
ncbi:MAG: metallophosphoesterase [Chromatiaceae bacterium]|nr:MAG: metallophosphoesterase [Chromatiaceae bacterium]